MEDGFEGWGGGWQSDQLGGVGVITWTREEREGGGCSKAFMRLGQQDQGKQVSRMAPSIWGVMGPSLPGGTRDKGMVLGEQIKSQFGT